VSDVRARPKGLLAVIAIEVFAALMIALYWVLFFSSPPALSDVPCYVTFEQAFPAADAWLAFAALVAAVGLAKRRPWGVLFTFLAGSASIFLGLMDVLYDLENGIYLKLNTSAGGEVAVEIAINVLTLTLGPAIIWYVWTRRNALLQSPT
jgi:hypothetical protein